MFKLISNPKVIRRRGIKPVLIVPLRKLVWIPKRCIPETIDDSNIPY